MSPTVQGAPVSSVREEIALAVLIGIIGALGLAIGVFTGRVLDAGLGALMVLFSGWALVSRG